MRTGGGRRSGLEVVPCVNYHFESAREGPEDFQYRDVEREACHRQPCAIRLGLEAGVHRGKKIEHVPVFDNHALRFARGSGGVNDIGDVVRRDAAVEILSAFLRDGRPIHVEPDGLCRKRWQEGRQAVLRY